MTPEEKLKRLNKSRGCISPLPDSDPASIAKAKQAKAIRDKAYAQAAKAKGMTLKEYLKSIGL